MTGTVADVRPYLAHARAAVAPLRVARGVQNKVLEALAMGLPVAGTPAAVEGIEDGHGLDPWLADDPQALAQRVVALLDGPVQREELRRFVLERYDWSASVAAMVRLLEGKVE